ncbi:hypothetical protein RN001_002551 [Aquatica leii]|uniref:Cuticle protein n=1 Tax=Aquatica leii TaxID=1421715 RepID=A0AAN7QB59_9COLE|nr:hypothetical protein RN001_002551 [Aquatica leii]
MHLQGVFIIGLCSLALSVQVEPILSQFQDAGDQGQYKYSYQSGIESKSEQRTPDGRTIGSYSYIDTNGKIQHVKYSAGVEGFQVITSDTPSTNLPRSHFSPSHIHQQGVIGDTPEVVAARNQHFAAHEAALRDAPRVSQQTHAPHPVSFHGPPAVPVLNSLGILQDTPEVAAAKAHHAAAHAEVRKILPTLPQQNLFGNTARFPSLHHTEPIIDFPRHNHHGFTKFAEEIPRSALGETPEVAAAREAHLAFYAKVKSQLPDDERPKPQFPF